MGRDLPSWGEIYTEPTTCINKMAMNICIATEQAIRSPGFLGGFLPRYTEDLHTISPHCLLSGSESVCLAGYSHHQPDSREEKHEM